MHERLCGHGDHSARHLLVDIDYFGHVGGVVYVSGSSRVIDVGDGSGSDHGIAAIDVIKISAAYRIRGLVDFARREREPAHCGCNRADGQRDLQILAPDKRYQRRRIDSLLTRRPWDPAPRASDVCPTAIVRNGKAPRRVVHPSPAPRVYPGPMAVAVRGPACGHVRWRPNVAVAWVLMPAAVRIQVFIANHFG